MSKIANSQISKTPHAVPAPSLDRKDFENGMTLNESLNDLKKSNSQPELVEIVSARHSSRKRSFMHRNRTNNNL